MLILCANRCFLVFHAEAAGKWFEFHISHPSFPFIYSAPFHGCRIPSQSMAIKCVIGVCLAKRFHCGLHCSSPFSGKACYLPFVECQIQSLGLMPCPPRVFPYGAMLAGSESSSPISSSSSSSPARVLHSGLPIFLSLSLSLSVSVSGHFILAWPNRLWSQTPGRFCL